MLHNITCEVRICLICAHEPEGECVHIRQIPPAHVTYIMYLYICVYIYVLYVYMYCMYIYVLYIYICMYIYVYMYVCIYVCNIVMT